MTTRRLSRWMLLAVLALTAGTARHSAQEPEAIRKVVLPSLDSQVAARLIALDSRLNVVHSPGTASGFPSLPAAQSLAISPVTRGGLRRDRAASVAHCPLR